MENQTWNTKTDVFCLSCCIIIAVNVCVSACLPRKERTLFHVHEDKEDGNQGKREQNSSIKMMMMVLWFLSPLIFSFLNHHSLVTNEATMKDKRIHVGSLITKHLVAQFPPETLPPSRLSEQTHKFQFYEDIVKFEISSGSWLKRFIPVNNKDKTGHFLFLFQKDWQGKEEEEDSSWKVSLSLCPSVSNSWASDSQLLACNPGISICSLVSLTVSSPLELDKRQPTRKMRSGSLRPRISLSRTHPLSWLPWIQEVA